MTSESTDPNSQWVVYTTEDGQTMTVGDVMHVLAGCLIDWPELEQVKELKLSTSDRGDGQIGQTLEVVVSKD